MKVQMLVEQGRSFFSFGGGGGGGDHADQLIVCV